MQRMDAPHVAVSMIRSLMYFLEQRGLDAQALASDAGLAADHLAERDRLVAAECYVDLMQRAIEHTANPLLGLEFGMAVEPDRWGMLGVLLSHCANVGEALRFQARFQALVSTVGQGRLSDDGRDLTLHWQAADNTPPALIEEALGAYVAFGRWAIGRPIAPRLVRFRHAPQAEPGRYRALFGCAVHFEAARDEFLIERDILDMPLRNPDPHLKEWLARRARRLQQERLEDDIRARLAQWFAQQLPFGVPTLEDAAHALALTPRRLQRQLHAADSSFSDSLADVRLHLADHYLRDASLSIGDIGLLLGFSEQSAFQRAFKRWHGTTPRAYRRRVSAQTHAP